MSRIRTALVGLLIGCSLYFVAEAAVGPTPKIPEPPKVAFKTCEERILYRLNFYSDMLVQLRVPYIWGGYWGRLGGDCSGQIRWICRMAGLPYLRTTSLQMWLNKGAWPGQRIFVKVKEQDLVEFPNLIFWTYDAKRPFGHVALTVWNATDKNGKRTILFREASFSKGYFKETETKKGDIRWEKMVGILIMDLTPGFKCEL